MLDEVLSYCPTGRKSKKRPKDLITWFRTHGARLAEEFDEIRSCPVLKVTDNVLVVKRNDDNGWIFMPWRPMEMKWMFEQESIDWVELSNLYKIAPLGDKKPEDLKIAFSNSRYKCFVFDHEKLIGVGRALADGVDCSYLCDVAVHPDYQGIGLGKDIINKLKELSAGHKKIILYANPGKEGFYKKLGFMRMRTAMAIFRNQERAVALGLIDEA